MRVTKSVFIATTMLFCISCVKFEESHGAKILSVQFFASKSHKITYEPLLRELARRGHEITLLSPVNSKNGTNFKNIMLIDSDELYNKIPNMFEMKLSMPTWLEAIFTPFVTAASDFADLCERSYQLPQVQQALKEKWDLIFFTPTFSECLYGMLHKLNTSTILFTPATVFPWTADNLGSPNPPSHTSSIIIGHDERMNFRERLSNFVRTLYDWLVLNYYYFPKMESVYRKALNDPTIPSVKEIERNVSIVLMNSHISISPPRPLLPDIIEVGGSHLVPAKPVQPKSLNDFLDGAKDGFILFSMGSALKGNMMPEKYRQMFLNVFSKLKQRVIWKWETEEMDGVPPNVKLSKWLPQQDVLGHKNIRAFITHGGMGGTTEAMYHGVPLIGIPIFGDQLSNMLIAAKKGFALPPLEFNELTEDILVSAINKVVDDPSYMKTAKRLSAIFNDQQTKPMDRAVYWVEYVLRHQGATHLRSAARDLNYIQYFSIDVIAVLAVIGIISAVINFMVLRALLRKCLGVKMNKTVKSSKKEQ